MVTLSDALIDRFVTFKLLGVNVTSDQKWNTHTEAMSRTVASRLYFLKQLKLAGAGLNDLLNFYCFHVVVVDDDVICCAQCR